MLVVALLGAHTIKTRENLAPSEMAQLVSVTVDVPPDARPVLRERLTTLFGSGPLEQLAKAIDVLTEHERVFHNARILTDIRPVFSEDPAAPPTAAVLVQVLKVDYHENDERKSFFVALDTNDVRRLTQIVERASTKADALRLLLVSAGVPLIEVGEE